MINLLSRKKNVAASEERVNLKILSKKVFQMGDKFYEEEKSLRDLGNLYPNTVMVTFSNT